MTTAMSRPGSAAARTPETGHRELRRVLVAQVLLVPVYAAFPLLGLLSDYVWAAILMQVFTWVVVVGLLVHWSLQRRSALIQRAVAWALLSWATPLGLPFLVMLPPTRRLLVPPVPGTSRHPFWTTSGSAL